MNNFIKQNYDYNVPFTDLQIRKKSRTIAVFGQGTGTVFLLVYYV